MDRATWNVDVHGTGHQIELRWSYWGGRREVYVDGTFAAGDTKVLRWKSRHPVDVAGKTCTVITRPKKHAKTVFDVFLDVDGQERAPDNIG
ncbi:hypothetical protein [uncultured Jatrophihabitans sp.]|uniref:hypothetical protein n=1 Tax=uncultured Jatrophihabitans sp. TaxID=1610747 RepID=UPI0035CB4D92